MKMNYTSAVYLKEKKIINTNYSFYFILLIMLLFVIFRYYNITTLIYFFLFIGSLFAVLNPIYGFILYLFSIAFKAYLLVMPGVTFSRYFGILFLIIMVFQISRRHIKMNKQLVFISLLILISEIISSFFSLAIISSLYGSSLYLMQIGILFGIVYLPENNKRLIKYIDITCLFSLFLLSCIAWLNRSSGYYGVRLSICEDFNPNQLAINLVFLCIIVFNFIFLTKVNYFGKIARIAVLLIGIWILFLSGSRSSMLGLLVGVIFSLFYQLKLIRNKKNNVLTIAIIFICIVTVLYGGFLNTKESQYIIDRYSYDKFLNIENLGRYYIWEGYLTDIVPEFWLFGTGGAKSGSLYLSKFGIYSGGHNIIIAILVQFGIVGLIIFISFFAITFFKSLKFLKKDSNILPFIAAFIALIMVGIGENIFSQKVFWFSMAMCWRLSIKNKTADVKREVV